MATDLQKQTVDEGKSLDETSAGQGLKSELLKEQQKLTKERQDLQVLIKKAQKEHGVDKEEALREESDRYAVLIKRAEESARALKITMENLVAKRDLRVAEMSEEIREVQTEYENNFRLMTLEEIELNKEKVTLENREKQRQSKLGSKAVAITQEAGPPLPGQRPRFSPPE